MVIFNDAMMHMKWAKSALEKGDIKSCLNQIINAKGIA